MTPEPATSARERGAGRPPRAPHPRSGLRGYLLIGSVCTLALNLVSHFRGGPTLVQAFHAGPLTHEGMRLLLDWGIGPFLLWPLWLPLAILNGLRDVFA